MLKKEQAAQFMRMPVTYYMVEGGGFEPPKALPTDLQSVPFDHSGTPPNSKNNGQPSSLKLDISPSDSKRWSWRWDLNPQPPDYKSGALPIELRQHYALWNKSYNTPRLFASFFFLLKQKNQTFKVWFLKHPFETMCYTKNYPLLTGFFT